MATSSGTRAACQAISRGLPGLLVEPDPVRCTIVTGHDVKIAVAIDVDQDDGLRITRAESLARIEEGAGAIIEVEAVGIAEYGRGEIEITVAVDIAEGDLPGHEVAARNLAAVGTPELPKSAGMHRFVWDLRYAGAWDAAAERSGQRGPMVAPGTYQARLTAGGSSNTVSFEAMMDPRVVEAGVTDADITSQVELALKSRDGLSNARLAALRVEEALEKKPGDATLTEIKTALITAARRYSQPMLVDQFSYLYGNQLSADQKPGEETVKRYEELTKQLQEQVQKLEKVLQTTENP